LLFLLCLAVLAIGLCIPGTTTALQQWFENISGTTLQRCYELKNQTESQLASVQAQRDDLWAQVVEQNNTIISEKKLLE
jgi:hypothetical protein